MKPSPGPRSRESALTWEDFERRASHLLVDLESATGSPPDALRRSAAESLLVLRLAGELVLPELRSAGAATERGSLRDLVDGPLTDLVEVASHGSLSTGTLWGNIASVIESSARIVASEKPASAAWATDIATQSLVLEPLRECWTGEVGATFRRTTCCLVVGPDPDELRCGDCVRGGSPH